MKLFIITSADPIEIACEPSDTVLAIKHKICHQSGVPIDTQFLEFDGLYLMDIHTLATYDIPPDATLYLWVKVDHPNSTKVTQSN